MSDAFLIESVPLLAGTGEASAVFDPARVYRYCLERTWGTSGTHAVWIMLNPSTADALTDDPTIRRCTAFTKAWGLDGLIVVNLFAYRATDPRELRRFPAGQPAPVGPDNDRFIAEAIQPWSTVVAAWGAHPFAGRRAAEVRAIIERRRGWAGCLGVTKAGHPRHPLYCRSSTRLVTYLGFQDPTSLEVSA